ncbi:MAG: iron-containing alcohol dehydrogenase [Clostridia bacterium]|nr:iron-containing alcohol dehydrogenase [Clostridia bacterium]
MKDFVFSYPTKVYFGKGAAGKALDLELKNYKKIMLAYGGGSVKKNGIYDEIMELLKNKDVIEFSGIMSNPTYKKVQEGAGLARENSVDFILAVGGGSVIDCCKVVAAQAVTDEDIWEMEFVNKKFPTEWIPMGAVVTASGTGSEMNAGAVITNEDKKIKAGVFAAYADFAVLDPYYTLSVPFKQVISGTFDTLSHCMETYFGTPRESFISDEINEAVMRNVIYNIRQLIKNPEDIEARSELMWDSAMAENGLLKLGKVTDFQAHQIEHQLGAYTDCNHGQGLAVIHPVLYSHIYSEAAGKFVRFAKVVWNITEGKSEVELAVKGINALTEFIKEIGLPTNFREMGITDTKCFRAVADSCNITAGCCKKLTKDEIFEILEECY